MYGFEPVEEENTQYNSESYDPRLLAEKKAKKPELASNYEIKKEQQPQQTKKDQQPLQTKKINEPLPMSLNIGEKYEPQDFLSHLRKPYMTKFEEDLLKIRLSFDALVRNEQDEVKKNQEFESKRLKENQERAKKIPKQSILAKIEEMHKKKYPQFKVDMFLKPNVDDDSLDLPHDLYIQHEEKKIQEKISKKNALQRQQDVLIQQLTETTQIKLGFKSQPKNENENPERESEDQLGEQQIATVNVDVSKTTNDNLAIQASTIPSTLTRNPLKKEEIRPENNISPPKIRPWQQLLQQRQMRSTSAYVAKSTKNNSISSKNDQNEDIFNFDLLKKKVQKPNSKSISVSHTNTPTNQKVLFPRGSIRLQQGQQLNKQEQYIDISLQQQTSNQQKTFPTEILTKTIPINVLAPKEISLLRPKKKTKIELDRERRQTSPLKFLFTKYENLVQDGYDDYKAEMKDIADLYLADPPKTRKPARSQQPRLNPNRNMSDSLTPNSRQKQLSLQRAKQEQKQQEQKQQQQQQQSPRHSQQKNQQPMSALSFQPVVQSNQRDLNSFEGILQLQLNGNKIGFQEKRAATSIPYENEYRQRQSPQQQHIHKKERSRFLDRNKLIKLKNEQLSKSLLEFIADEPEFKQAALDCKKISAEFSCRLEQMRQPQRMSETYNVTDFLHRIRYEQQNKANENIKEEMNKTQGNSQLKSVANSNW